LIAGLEVPDAGSIRIGNQPVAGDGVFVATENRRVGMVFQDYALFPHLSVSQNIAFGVQRRASETRVQDGLRVVGLCGVGGRMPHELSGGQQQRVAIARALAPHPAVLLLDEPFSNLDAGLRQQVRAEIRDILKANRLTAIFVTHDQDEALFMGDRIAVFNAGRLEQVGTPEELFFAPTTRFVAEFMGQADFIRAEISEQGLQTEIGLVRQPVALPVGQRVEVAIRADDVSLAADPQSKAKVLGRSFRGAVNVYRVRLPSGRIVHSLQPHTLKLADGLQVRVQAEPGHPLAHFAI
jgi:iron(III) transport system ATP-binding protein